MNKKYMKERESIRADAAGLYHMLRRLNKKIPNHLAPNGYELIQLWVNDYDISVGKAKTIRNTTWDLALFIVNLGIKMPVSDLRLYWEGHYSK